MGSGGGDQTPAPTAQEKALAKVGAEQWNDYAQRYAGAGGVNERFIEQTRASASDRSAASGQVGADAAIAARQTKKSTARGGLSRGISSASGATLAEHSDDSSTLASTEGRARGVAVQGADDAQLAADFKLASFGRGLSSDAQVGLQRSTRRATNLVNQEAENKFREKQSYLEAAGTGIGMYSQTKGLFSKEGKK